MIVNSIAVNRDMRMIVNSIAVNRDVGPVGAVLRPRSAAAAARLQRRQLTYHNPDPGGGRGQGPLLLNPSAWGPGDFSHIQCVLQALVSRIHKTT